MSEKHPVYCAWCLDKGIKTIIKYSTVKDSHGICQLCMNKYMKKTSKEDL